MSSIQTITKNLNDAHDIAWTLGACWDAFEYIGQAADSLAIPESELFAAFAFAACAASEGRDVLGRAPTMPAQPIVAEPLIPDETEPDTAAGALAALATEVKSKLAAASLSGTPADQAAMMAASRCAAEIAGLLG